MTDTDTIAQRSVALSAARRVVDAACAAAEEMSRAMCIAVVDVSGEPVMSVRMDCEHDGVAVRPGLTPVMTDFVSLR